MRGFAGGHNSPRLPRLEDGAAARAAGVEEREVEVAAGQAERRLHRRMGHGVRPRGRRVVVLQQEWRR